MTKFRIWLSVKLFWMGRKIHPEISQIERKIMQLQSEIAAPKILAKSQVASND